MMPTKWPAVVLTLFLLTSVEASAFEAGEHVYVKTQPNTWMPATYVGRRNDCFKAEPATNPQGVRLEAPSELIKGKIEIGADIFKRLQDPRSEYKSKYIVRETQLSCHVLEKLGGVWAGRNYAFLGDVIPAAEFKKLIGLKRTLNVGETVYAQNRTEPESWSLYKVVSKHNSCFETDSETVLSIRDFQYGEFYFPPTTPVKNPTAGDTVFIRTSFAPNVWVKVIPKIKKTKGKKLTLLLPYVDSEDFFEEEVNIGDIRGVPQKLSEADFSGLKPGATVLQLVDPQACDYLSYVPRKVAAVKSDCYALRRSEYSDDSFETETYLPEKLIEAELLKSGRSE